MMIVLNILLGCFCLLAGYGAATALNRWHRRHYCLYHQLRRATWHMRWRVEHDTEQQGHYLCDVCAGESSDGLFEPRQRERLIRLRNLRPIEGWADLRERDVTVRRNGRPL